MVRTRNRQNPLLDYGWGQQPYGQQRAYQPPYADPLNDATPQTTTGFQNYDPLTSLLDAPGRARKADPYGLDNTDSLFPMPRMTQPHAQATDAVQLTPEDEKSLLSSIAQKGGSALQYAGESLDKGGAAVRGVLSGLGMGDKPGDWGGGLLNLIPFSDWMGITDQEKKIQAEDLTGWKSQESDPWYQKAGNFAGNTAVAIGLDPLTYIGLSGLSRAGKLAKSAGIMDDLTTLATRSKGIPEAIGKRTARMFGTPKTLMEAMPEASGKAAAKRWADATSKLSPSEAAARADEKLGGLFNVRIPGMNPLFTYGAGMPGAATAAHYLDKAGNAVRWSGAGRTLSALMNSDVMGAKTRIGQENAAMLAHALPRAEALAQTDVNDVGRLINQLGLTDSPESKAALTSLLESKDAAYDAAVAGVGKGDQQREALARMLRETYDKATASSLERQQLLGAGPEQGYQDAYTNYMTRHLGSSIRGKGGNTTAFGTQVPEEVGRQEFLTEIPGGTNTLNKVSSDKNLNELINGGKATLGDVSSYIKNNYGDVLPATYQTHEDLRKIAKMVVDKKTAAEIAKEVPARDRYTAIAETLAGLPPELRSSGGMFPNHPLMDFATGASGANRAVARADMALNTLAGKFGDGNVLLDGAEEASRPARIEGSVPLAEVLRGIGLRYGDETKGAFQALSERTGRSIENLKLSRVQGDVAADLLKVNERFTAPVAVGTVGKWLDNANALWKAGVTTRMAFQPRNWLGGQVQDVVNFGPKALGELPNVRKMTQGKDVAAFIDHPLVIQEAKRRLLNPSTLDAHEATNIMRELAQRNNIIENYAGEAASRSGATADEIGGKFADYSSQLPGGIEGTAPMRKRDVLKKFFGFGEGSTPKLWSKGKVNIRGVGDTTTSTLGPVAANEAWGNIVETQNRLPSWISLTRKGIDPTEAKRMVESAQVVYGGSHYTPFEQQVLGRLFPFYKFGKGMATHTAKQLAEKPGGALAQLIKAEGKLSDAGDVTLPDYLKQSLTIPVPEGTPLIGPEPGGDPRYFTGLGLMHEQDPFGFGGGGLQGVGLEALSRMNPLVKGPIEAATGVSAFQRGPAGPRALEDQDPLVGRLIQNIADSANSYATGQPVRTRDPVRFPGSTYLETILGNSPVSSVLSTARTGFDPRKNYGAKALNLLTGSRVTDVSQRTQEAQIGEELKSMMKKAGAKDFENVYFNAEQKAAMTPEERLWAEKAMALKNMFAKRQRARAKAALAAP